MFAPGSIPRTTTSLFSLEGWTDARPALIEEGKKLKPWTFLIHPEISEDAVLSAPEAFDPKTDVGCLESIPLQELIARKTIVPAASLSESEMVDLCDALLIYQSQYMKSEHITNTLFTCAYLHDLSLVEGSQAIKAFVRGVLKSIDISIKTVTNADVRDGDEEFVPYCYDILPLSDDSVQSILDELDAAIKTAPEALKSRLTLQRALIAAADGFASVHHYVPSEAPEARKNFNAYEEKMKQKHEERRKKAIEKAEAAKEAKKAAKENKDGAAASSSSSPATKEAEEAAAAAATKEEEDEEQEIPSSLIVYTKEELDKYRPKNIDVSALSKAFQTAVNGWHRSGEPAKTEKAFSKYAPLWVSGAAPSKQVDLTPLATAKAFYKELAANFNALVQLKAQKVFNNWYILLNAVKQFSASAGVLARSIGMLFIYNPAVDLLLDSKSFAECILHTCDVMHGQPLYNHLYFEHHDIVSALTQAQMDKSPIPESIKKNAKAMKGATESIKRQLIETARDAVQDVARTCFRYIHTLLRSKGAIHRTLATINVPQVSNTITQVGTVEQQVFGILPTRGAANPTLDAKTQRHFVLTSFASEVMFDMVDTQLNLEVSLGLISKPEATALQMYRFFNIHSRLENSNTLFVEQSALPSQAAAGAAKNKNNLKTLIDAHGAAAACRQAKPAPTNVLKSYDCVKVASNIAFMVLACLGPFKINKVATSGVIPGLDQGPFSLVSTETVVDRRFQILRAYLGEKLFPTYKEIVKGTSNLTDAKSTLQRCVDVLQPTLNNLKKHIEAKTGGNQALPLTVAFESVMKQNLAVVMAAKGLIENSDDKNNLEKVFANWKFDFEYVAGYPQLIRFTLSAAKN